MNMYCTKIPFFDPRAVAESGQCFRMNPCGDGFRLIAGGESLAVSSLPDGRFLFSCDASAFARKWAPYFDLDTDYTRFQAALAVSPDPFLRAAAEHGKGIRILRQDPWEMLISFLISQRKSIPAIKRAIELLCTHFGAPLPDGGFAFPTAKALAEAPGEALRACGLGYRTPYIAAAAQSVAAGETDLSALSALPDEELEPALRRLPGVGPKVAACIMLFGFHRLRAFPRDVWMNRAALLCGGDFALCGCDGFEGVVQQYIFCYARQERDFLFPGQRV